MLKNKRKWLLICFILMLSVGFVGCGQTKNDSVGKTQEVKSVFDAPSYSRISKADLFAKFGETSDIEEWNNKTTKGTFPMTIYSYDDKDSNHYEFIVAKDTDTVVRVTMYSAKNWVSTGTDIKYTKKSLKEMLALLKITPKDSAKVIADTGVAYRVRPVSDDVGDVWFLELSEASSTFGMVKITYN